MKSFTRDEEDELLNVRELFEIIIKLLASSTFYTTRREKNKFSFPARILFSNDSIH